MIEDGQPRIGKGIRSRRARQTLRSIGRNEARRRRRAIVVSGAVILCLVAWHLYPFWKMWTLESTVSELRRYREMNGHFPLAKTDVKSLVGADVAYWTDANGSGFELSFSHLCLYDLGDLRHWDYDPEDDSWFSHAD